MSAAFQALTWEARDVDDSQHIISIFGRSENGQSVCVSTEFKPYFFVKLGNRDPGELFRKIKEVCPVVTNYSVSKAKDLWGFQNNELQTFMRLNFTTLQNMKQCDYALRRKLPGETYLLKVYEANIEPVLRLMHRTGIQSTGWLDTGDCVPGDCAKTDVDLFQNDWRNLKPIKRDDIAPFIIASFDIETNSSTGKFPDADVDDDSVFQIAVTLRKQGHQVHEKVCLCYKETAPLEDAEVISFKTEKELIEGFQRYIEKKDVDVITGWNIFGFDLEYVYKRAIVTGASQKFFQLSKLRDHHCEMVYKKLSSSALGDNALKLLPMPGRFIFDLFHEVKREQKLDSYSLNFVSKKFLGDQKIDMSPKEMFRRFREEDPKELSEVAEYCVKDTLLPHALMDKLFTFLNLVEMAKATWVPLCYLAERGQQIKVFSQLTRKARELNFMVPVIRFDKNKQGAEGYEGATVLSAQTGAYYAPITALDFASLYPSIMMAHNLCYSSLVMSPKYDNVPGIEYETFGTHKFAQGVPSLLPAILDELKLFRKQAKKDMAIAKAAKNHVMEKIYDGKQLAYKVSMNSVYGFTGAAKGMLPCLAIASTVTMKGRSMIEETKNYVEKHFPGAVVRYGDSVTGETPLLLRVQGKITFQKISSLGCRWYTDGDKEFSPLGNIESWTETGWTKVHTIIRHRCQKKIFRVTTESGSVCVTEDHSLLEPGGVMVKPGHVQVGNRLLHSFPAPQYEELPETVCVVSNEVEALEMYYAFRAAGYHVLVQHALGKYTLTPQKEPVSTKITSIVDLGVTSDYVYDLTTENHHFHAGVGSLIVHNTDSVMVEFDVQGRTGVEAIEYSWELGERASNECSKLFKHPNDLELEKVYCPYFLYSKKRYAAKMWVKGKSGAMELEKIDVKGLQLVRRDNTPFVREVCKELLDVILESNNPNGAIELAKKRAVELLDGRVPMEKLILSQKLADSYASDNLPHVQVRNKMRDREPGSEPQSGDRVQFVIVHGTGDKQFEKSEDPGWAKANGVPLDYQYYFTNKFMNPVCDLLEPLIKDRDSIFGDLMLSKKKVYWDPKQPKIGDFFKRTTLGAKPP